jgi:nicotinamide-nucleotide amidase
VCIEHTLEGEIGQLLRYHDLKLAVAESATGGLIAARIVHVAGSSEYFKGGVVAYDNAVKERVLGVSAETLATQGAVSEETAREMAEGVMKLMGAEVAISDTGIAGPAGGTPTKPVGLFYIGLASARGVRAEEYFFSGTRGEIRHQAEEKALVMLRDYLRGLPE